MLVILLFALVACAAWVIYKRHGPAPPPKLDLPYVQFDGDNSAGRYRSESLEILTRGYKTYLKNGVPFSMRNPSDPKRPMVLLPLKYLDEVKWIPEERLSFWRHIDQLSILSQIGGPGITHEVALGARAGLNRGLPYLIQPLQEACLAAFEKHVPACPDWMEIRPYQLIVKIFASMSACAMVGRELGDLNSEWQVLSMKYVEAALRAPGKVKEKYPPYLYWLSRYFNDAVKTMFNIQGRASELLKPVLAERIATKESGPTNMKRTGRRKYEDAIQWLLDGYAARGKDVDPVQVTRDIFVIMTASIHSTSGAGLCIIFDMMEHPEAIQEIMEELARVKSANPTWSRQALSELRLLDSFMRESARVHSLTQYTAVQRIPVAEPFTFKDGLKIPPNTTLAFASYNHNFDPDVHEDPTKFDPKRHLRKRRGTDTHKFHFASVSEDMINWGAGRHACPGRFFAQETLKLMLVQFLTHYEFRHTGEIAKIPQYIPANLFCVPNPLLPVMIREKQTM